MRRLIMSHSAGSGGGGGGYDGYGVVTQSHLGTNKLGDALLADEARWRLILIDEAEQCDAQNANEQILFYHATTHVSK